MSDRRSWDSRTYDRISGPMEDMALPVLDRLELRGDETVIDAGCGSGRVTEALRERLPDGHVIAVDGSADMLRAARDRLGDERVTFVEADLVELDLGRRADALLSTATFHWIADQAGLYAALARSLRPGGRLVAQCGGEGNIADVRGAVAAVLAADEALAERLDGYDPWRFLGPDETRGHLEAAGFTAIRTWLQAWPVPTGGGREWLRNINLGGHVERIADDELADRFIAAVHDQLGGDPLTLHYVRLNIDATA
ncbi:MAG: trans-aconitate 2-methyltransferase [Solirubrobacteraceae bacterium]|nr:trans-aconitate 2-methyltransferase [Solirubrobacteraceae bacterium]